MTRSISDPSRTRSACVVQCVPPDFKLSVIYKSRHIKAVILFTYYFKQYYRKTRSIRPTPLCSAFVPNQGVGIYSEFVQNIPCTTFVYRKHASSVWSTVPASVCVYDSIRRSRYEKITTCINRSHGINCRVGLYSEYYGTLRRYQV